MGDPRELRVSDADREAAAQRLYTALGEGRITLVELEERVGVVYAARTYADLEPPLADLPGATVAFPAPVAGRAELRTTMGSITRDGDWPVPSSLLLGTQMGSIDLDLRGVRAVPPRIDVEVRVGMGEVRIALPATGTADVRSVRSAVGQVVSTVPSAPGPGPHLTVTGRIGMGNLTIRLGGDNPREFQEW